MLRWSAARPPGRPRPGEPRRFQAGLGWSSGDSRARRHRWGQGRRTGNSGCLREGLLETWEVGNQVVDAGDGKDAQDGNGGDDQQYLTALGLGLLVRAYQAAKR